MVVTLTPACCLLVSAGTECDADTLTAPGQADWLRGKQNSSVFILFLENNYRLLSRLDRVCYRITKIVLL